MSFAALVRDMAAAGATAEAIAIAIEAIEARDAVAADRRAQAADRKRRQRERERDSHATVTGQSQDEPSLSRPPNENISNPPTHTHPDNISRTRKGGWLCPEGVQQQHWDDYLGNRKRKRLANTQTAYAGQLRQIAKFADDEWPPGRIVQHAAEMGWGGIYDPRERGLQNGKHRNDSGSGSGGGGRREDAWQSVLRGVADGQAGGRNTTDAG